MEGKAVRIAVGGATWFLRCEGGSWRFTDACDAHAEFLATPNAAWRYLTKGCGPEGVQITGEPTLAVAMSKVLAVMA
jgi:hypothetical protein